MFIATFLIDGMPQGTVYSDHVVPVGAAQDLFKCMNGIEGPAQVIVHNSGRSMSVGDQARIVKVSTGEKWLLNCEGEAWSVEEYGAPGVSADLVADMIEKLDSMQATWILGGCTSGFADAIHAYAAARSKVEQAIVDAAD